MATDFCLLKRGTKVDLSTISNLYEVSLAISKEKVADLRRLMRYVPQAHVGYFNDIFATWESTVAAADAEDVTEDDGDE